MPDYYDILGLAHDADAEEVKAAFHRLAKIYHPDLNAGDATAEARFKKINQAYETLSDSEQRAAYDLEFRGGPRVYRHTGESRASATKSSATANHAPSSSQRWQVAATGICIGLLLGAPAVLWLSGTFAGPQKAKTVPTLPSFSAPGEFFNGKPFKVAKIAVRPIEPTTFVAGPLEPRAVEPHAVEPQAVELAPPLQAGRNAVRDAPPSTLDRQAANLQLPPGLTALTTQALPAAAANPAVIGGFQIQIGAFQSVGEAERQLALVRERVPDMLSLKVGVTQRVQQGQTVLYQARYAGFDGEAAASACSEMKRNNIACLVLRADWTPIAPPDTRTVASAPSMQLLDQHDDSLAQETRRSEHGDVAVPGLTVDTSALAPTQPAHAPGNVHALAEKSVKTIAATQDSAKVLTQPTEVIGITSGFVAVVSSQKSRMDALKAFIDLQQKYSDVLASKTPDVQEANLGDKGVWYRAVVGPPGSRDDAAGLCSQLKTAGYPGCWVVAY
jgi:cell division protein FtsN